MHPRLARKEILDKERSHQVADANVAHNVVVVVENSQSSLILPRITEAADRQRR